MSNFKNPGYFFKNPGYFANANIHILAENGDHHYLTEESCRKMKNGEIYGYYYESKEDFENREERNKIEQENSDTARKIKEERENEWARKKVEEYFKEKEQMIGGET